MMLFKCEETLAAQSSMPTGTSLNHEVFDFFSNSSDLKIMKTSSKNLTAAQRLALGWIQNVNVIAGFLSTPCHSFYPGFAQRCMPPVLALLKRKPITCQVVEYCVFGMPLKKSTLFVGFHLSLIRLSRFRCIAAKRRLCRHSNLPHLRTGFTTSCTRSC